MEGVHPNAVDQQVDRRMLRPCDLVGTELNDFLPPRRPDGLLCRVDEAVMRAPAIDEHIAEVEIEQPRGNRGERVVGGLARLWHQPGKVAAALVEDAVFGERVPQYRQVILGAATKQEGASCESGPCGGRRHRATSLLGLAPEMIIVRFQPE